MSHSSREGFSAHVDLKLQINGDILDVARIGPTSLTIRDDYTVRGPCDAQLTVKIDDHVETEQIILSNGVDSGNWVVTYSRISAYES